MPFELLLILYRIIFHCPGDNGQWYSAKTVEGSAKSMFESWQICTAFRKMAHVLCTTADPYYRWWNVETESNRCDERCTTFFEDFAHCWLYQSTAVRCEERFFLSNSRCRPYEMPGEVKGKTISTDGREKFKTFAKVRFELTSIFFVTMTNYLNFCKFSRYYLSHNTALVKLLKKIGSRPIPQWLIGELSTT